MLVILTALHCEAKPLIAHFKLKVGSFKSPFPIYHNDKVYLGVSGIGKVNAAFAVSYLGKILEKYIICWLNVGIAGHRRVAINALFVADKVIDGGTLKTYYPTHIDPLDMTTSTLCTVDKPETIFPDEYLYDMEASGFMQAALKFSTSELTHCVKIVSDNLFEKTPLDGKIIERLIGNHLTEIQSFGLRLLKLAEEVKTAQVEDFLPQCHFTVTEKWQLHRLLVRYRTLNGTLSLEEFKGYVRAKDLLEAIENKINSQSLHF